MAQGMTLNAAGSNVREEGMRSGIKSSEWRPWFAWRPVEVGNMLYGGTEWCWFEWLEKRRPGAWEGAHAWSAWVYRFPATGSPQDERERNETNVTNVSEKR